MELAPDGSGYRLHSRFCRNAAHGIIRIMPHGELCRMGSGFAHVCLVSFAQDAA
jgi:hypothetical protein